MNDSSSTTSQWLHKATEQLQTADISTARLDCLVLLEDALQKDRSWLLAHPETTIQGPALEALDKKVERRATHEPLAYIRGKAEFYGRDFLVDSHVLVPRPESETMIELLKALGSRVKGEGLRIADIGTGSGALAVTAKLELPNAEVLAIDIDEECLKQARANAVKHKVDIQITQGNLLGPLSEIQDLRSKIFLLANLPYVPDTHPINRAAEHEPKLALYGGPDGLNLYKQLFDQISKSDLKPVHILTEALPSQHHYLAAIAREHGYIQIDKKDFIQVFAA